MNEMAGVRKKLQGRLGQKLPDHVWGDIYLQDLAKECLAQELEEDRNESWGLLEEAAERLLKVCNEERKAVLRSVQGGPADGLRYKRGAASHDSGWSVGDRTEAMTGAMSALFVLIGDQIPEVKEFREKILPGRFLSADEAHALIASYAARTLDIAGFQKWGVPFIGHRAEVVETGPRGESHSPVDASMTIHVDPPGVTKTVRYAYSREGENTRCSLQSGAVIPIHTYLPIEVHGDYTYPSWLWPGSVVDELYDLSVELASAFDWPLASVGNLSGTRPRSESAAWFVLTGEVPQVRPIDARWEEKRGSTHLSPQWRIQLTIPPWLPEEEVLQAFRTLRRQRPEGRQMPKTAKPLEVARFVWERERHEGYRETAPWTAWLKQWNDEHPGHRIKTASNFRTYFLRGAAAVEGLNFQVPTFEHHDPDTTLTPP